MKTTKPSRFSFKQKKRKNYFEGWYTRITDASQNIHMALIFAITYDQKDPHAFIQIFDAKKQTNQYIRFAISEFHYANGEVCIGKNRLTVDSLYLESEHLTIDVLLQDHRDMQHKSAMGYLSTFPLQCYQEVIYLEGEVKGTIIEEEKSMTIHGKSYMEKTYGRRFPKQWFWLQCNHFDNDIAITMAGGYVPTLFLKKFGFFVVLQIGDREHVFGTYNFAKAFISAQDDGWIVFTVRRKHLTLVVEAKQNNPVALIGPADGGQMTLDVLESITSDVRVKLFRDGKLINTSEGKYAGFEWMYNI